MTTVITTLPYVRKPLHVSAVEVTEENFMALAAWCQGEIKNTNGEPVKVNPEGGGVALDPKSQYVHVRVQNPKTPRQSKAFVGDWILYTERGYKVYTAKAFAASFDPVQEETGDVDSTHSQSQVQPEAVTEP